MNNSVALLRAQLCQKLFEFCLIISPNALINVTPREEEEVGGGGGGGAGKMRTIDF